MKELQTTSDLGYRLLGVAWLICGFMMLSFGMNRLSKGLRSQEWPRTPGEITASGVYLSSPPGQHSTYKVRVVYTYSVHQSEIQGSHITYKNLIDENDENYDARRLATAQNIARHYPVGRKINVSYDPNDNKTAAIEPGVNYLTFIPAFCGLILVALGLFFLTCAPSIRAKLRVISKRINRRGRPPIPINFS